MRDILIRPATIEDTDAILLVYAAAKQFMREHGNPTQWADDYPNAQTIADDIEAEALNVLVDKQTQEIVAACSVFAGPDPTYADIEGAWLNDKDYIAVHRFAVRDQRSGLGSVIINMLAQARSDIRIDTHHDNSPMQNFLEKHGFSKCGVIHLENGEPRLAYHKVYED